MSSLKLKRAGRKPLPAMASQRPLDVRAQLNALSGPRSAHYVIEKPVDIGELEKTVERALDECCAPTPGDQSAILQ